MKAIKFIVGLLVYLFAVILHVLLAYYAYIWFGLFWGIVVFCIPFLADLAMPGIAWAEFGTLNWANLLFAVISILYFIGFIADRLTGEEQ